MRLNRPFVFGSRDNIKSPDSIHVANPLGRQRLTDGHKNQRDMKRRTNSGHDTRYLSRMKKSFVKHLLTLLVVIRAFRCDCRQGHEPNNNCNLIEEIDCMRVKYVNATIRVVCYSVVGKFERSVDERKRRESRDL